MGPGGTPAPINDAEWQKIADRQLFTKPEMETLRSYKGFLPFLVISWGLEEVQAQVAAHTARLRALCVPDSR